jgi:hypothetical protein
MFLQVLVLGNLIDLGFEDTFVCKFNKNLYKKVGFLYQKI